MFPFFSLVKDASLRRFFLGCHSRPAVVAMIHLNFINNVVGMIRRCNTGTVVAEISAGESITFGFFEAYSHADASLYFLLKDV